MRCPYCHYSETVVLESRVAENGRSMRRRRSCEKCERRFTTYERAEGIDATVIKKSGEKERFDREKIKKGILKATWRRPLTMEEVEEIIDDVERRIRGSAGNEVKSFDIGKLVLEKLRDKDPLSSILFASVYFDFQTLEDFEKEIAKFK
ncbi:MAG TPA: transcriptional regulator NrdR [Patescibacteria group bacterium]|nr:transcriptional regulator NrdR [Patescibacteria group bacterium]